MTGVRGALLGAAVAALLAGCGGGDSQTAQPSPAVASSPSPKATDGEISPTAVGTVTAESASPAVTKHPGHTPDPTRDPRPPAATTIHLTEKDAGRTIEVRRGTVIIVELASGAASFRRPTTDAPDVLRSNSTSGGYPAEGPASATFTAIGNGTAQITSTTDAACLHSQPACMIPQQQFTVTIRVS